MILFEKNARRLSFLGSVVKKYPQNELQSPSYQYWITYPNYQKALLKNRFLKYVHAEQVQISGNSTN
jgi:hypothetical protein